MASYDLKCGACGHDFEVYVQGFLKETCKVCPECGSKEVSQVYTGFLHQWSKKSGADSGGHSCAPSAGFG
jgi:putative FmdB family regulatory protein